MVDKSCLQFRAPELLRQLPFYGSPRLEIGIRNLRVPNRFAILKDPFACDWHPDEEEEETANIFSFLFGVYYSSALVPNAFERTTDAVAGCLQAGLAKRFPYLAQGLEAHIVDL